MNFLAELRAFKILQLINRLSAGQRSLWLALIQIANDLHWREWFSVANVTLQSECGLSREGIIKARNVLKQKGYIDYRSNGTNATSYRIISLTMTDSTQDSTQGSTQDSTQGSTPLNKQDKTIQNKTSKEREERKKFVPPTVDEVKDYCSERGNNVNAERFIDFYTAKGWRIGKEPMKDWKAAVRTWESRSKEAPQEKKGRFNDFEETHEYDLDAIEEQAIAQRLGAAR